MKVGFIGGSGHHYLRGLLSDPEAAVGLSVAVAGDGHDEAASRTFVNTLERIEPKLTATWFDNGEAMLDQFRPDLVSVGGVYGFNGDWNARTLSRGIPTVTDKPAASTWAQLDRLRALCAADTSRVLLTEFDFHARRDFRAARACVLDGRIGEIVLVTAQKSYRFGQRPAWYADRAAYGGLVLWIASHGIDAVEFVTGRRITSCTGQGGNISRPDYGTSEDHVAIVAGLDNGGTAIVHADFGRPPAAPSHGDDRLRVVGSAGVVEVRDGVCRLTTTDVPETDVTASVDELPMHQALLEAALTPSPTSLFSTAHTLQTASLLLRIRDAVDQRQWLAVEWFNLKTDLRPASG